jgi:hypothetical protein
MRFALIIGFDMLNARTQIESARSQNKLPQQTTSAARRKFSSSTATDMRMPAILRSRSWSA